LCPQEKDEIARAIYDDFSSPQEELRHLMRMVKRSIQQRYTEDSTPVEVAAMAGAGAGEGNGASAATRAMASVRAIQNELMINADGTMAPLTLRQRLWYGSRKHLLVERLRHARKDAERIVDEVRAPRRVVSWTFTLTSSLFTGTPPASCILHHVCVCACVCVQVKELDVPNDSIKDVALVRHYILENTGMLHRYSLSRKFERIDGLPPEAIDPIYWVLGWMLEIGLVSFYLYWAFAWAALNGGAVVSKWGTDYGIAVAQDIMMYECVKIVTMVVFALMCARPQLHVIRRVINEAALSYVQDGARKDSGVRVVQVGTRATAVGTNEDVLNRRLRISLTVALLPRAMCSITRPRAVRRG
jgi:hypothetical protein